VIKTHRHAVIILDLTIICDINDLAASGLFPPHARISPPIPTTLQNDRQSQAHNKQQNYILFIISIYLFLYSKERTFLTQSLLQPFLSNLSIPNIHFSNKKIKGRKASQSHKHTVINIPF
jgi:hypothetical protein